MITKGEDGGESSRGEIKREIQKVEDVEMHRRRLGKKRANRESTSIYERQKKKKKNEKMRY